MRVEGFDKHEDGSGELRDFGMTPNLWHDWVCNAMQSHQTWRAARRGVADSIRSTSAGGLTRSPRSPDEARAFLRPGPSPVLAWAGSSQVATRLDELWREFEMTRSSPSDLPEDLEVVLDKPISRETNEGPNVVHVYLTHYLDLAIYVCRPASALVSLRVVRCRRVFGRDESNSRKKNPGLRAVLGPPSVCLEPQVAGRRLRLLASRHTRMRDMVTRRKGMQGHSRSEADLLFTHDLSGSDCTTHRPLPKRAVEGDLLQGTLENREFLIVQSLDE